MRSNDFHHDDEEYYHTREDYHHEKHKHTCWAKAFSRQAGFYPTCGKDGEQSGTYCYKKCEKGFTGVGPVCYQDCNNFGGMLPPPIPSVGIMNAALPTGGSSSASSAPSIPGLGSSGSGAGSGSGGEGGVGGLVSGGGDPRKGMHEDTEYCYKQETIKRAPGIPERNMKLGYVYKWGNKWYQMCPPNYHSVGCCICSPNCPMGMTDLGFKC